LTATYRKGDRLAIAGFFKVRTYEKNGEVPEIRELVITGARLEKMKSAKRPPEASRPPGRPRGCPGGLF
jgi:single-stranded DNA-binding protein